MREKEFLPLVSERLGIENLNPMQVRMKEAASESRDIMLLSPTGTGKTLAFMLVVLKLLKPSTGRVQAVIIAPSRELVAQIAGIASTLARDFKITTLYGGHNALDEANSLQAGTDIIVATPGRLLDHIRRRNIDVMPTRILVLDEFDKSLELGFAEEMKKIISHLKNVSRTVLTSATPIASLPDFVKLSDPQKISFLKESSEVRSRMRVHEVRADSRDKLESLLRLLLALRAERAIVFVNYRESAERVAEYLRSKGIACALYHGALDQIEREKAIAKFNNGSRPVLVATDLAARGLDIEGVDAIVHYHQPLTQEAYTHRNGRTARVARTGDIYLLAGPDEELKPYVKVDDRMPLPELKEKPLDPQWETLYIAEGKKEKLSRGDIAGFLIKEGGLSPDQVGKINVYDHYALVAVPRSNAASLVKSLAGMRLKGRKRRLRIAE